MLLFSLFIFLYTYISLLFIYQINIYFPLWVILQLHIIQYYKLTPGKSFRLQMVVYVCSMSNFFTTLCCIVSPIAIIIDVLQSSDYTKTIAEHIIHKYQYPQQVNLSAIISMKVNPVQSFNPFCHCWVSFCVVLCQKKI